MCCAKMSLGQNVSGAKCPWGKMSPSRLVEEARTKIGNNVWFRSIRKEQEQEKNISCVKRHKKNRSGKKKGVLCSCAPGDEVEPLLVPSLPAGGTIYLFQFNHLRFNSSATPTRTALLYKPQTNQTKLVDRRHSVSNLPKSSGCQQTSQDMIFVKELTKLQFLSHKFTLEHAICNISS